MGYKGAIWENAPLFCLKPHNRPALTAEFFDFSIAEYAKSACNFCNQSPCLQ